MRKIGVHDHRAVTPGAVAPLQGEPEQGLHRPGVAQFPLISNHSEGKDLQVGFESLGGPVGRGVVRHEQLILAAKLAEDLSDLPQNEAHRRALIVTRDAHVNHCLSTRSITER